MAQQPVPDVDRPATPRRGRLLPWLAGAALAFGLATAALVGWLGSESTLRMLADRAVAAAGGRLVIEAPAGSLFTEVRARRVIWQDAGLTVSVDALRLDPGWRAALTGTLGLRELSAERVEWVAAPSEGGPPPLPSSLRLPLPVRVDRLRIDELRLRDSGDVEPLRLTGIGGSLALDRTEWRVDDLAVEGPFGALRAAAAVGADAPFTLAGQLALQTRVHDQPLEVLGTLSGTLAAVGVQAKTTLHGAALSVVLRLEPFTELPLASLRVDAAGVDLARLVKGAPATRLSGRLETAPPANARPAEWPPLAGSLTLRNEAPGPLDADRLPLAAGSTRIAFDGVRLRLEELWLDGPAGRLTGSATLPVREALAAPDAPAAWPGLDVRLASEALDLARLHRSIRPTALRGSMRLRPDVGGLAFNGALADGELALEVGARLAGRTVQVSRARLRARDGETSVQGTADLVAPYRFDLSGQATGLDPARFAELPSGRLNGRWRAAGTVAPSPDIRLNLQMADSRWAGLPLSGSLQGRYASQRLTGVDAALQLGGTRATVRGNLGVSGDSLSLDVQSQRLQELDARLAGQLTLRGTLRGNLAAPGASLTATGRGLALQGGGRANTVRASLETGSIESLYRLGVRAGLLRPAPAGAVRDGTVGSLAATVAAERLEVGGQVFERVAVTFEGEPGQHSMTLRAAAARPALEAALRLEGGFADGEAGRWRGRLTEAAQVRAPAVRLLAPADLALSRGGLQIGPLSLQVKGSDGARFDLERLEWSDRRMSVRAAVSSVPLRWLIDASGGVGFPPDGPDPVRLGARIDLQGGLGAGGRLDGIVEAFRQSGDLTVEVPTADGLVKPLRAGLEQATASLAFSGDRVRAAVALRGTAFGSVSGNAQAALVWPKRGLAPQFDVPLEGRLSIEVPSLAFAHGMVGDAWQVDGSLRADLTLAGTVAAPTLSGPLAGTRLVAVQREFGMRLTDGEFAAVLFDNQIDIERLRFRSGDGGISMTGSLRADERSEAVLVLERMPIPLGAGQRLILSGTARAGLRRGVLSLSGTLRADEGVIEITAYDTPSVARDVVIVRDDESAARHRAEVFQRAADRAAGGGARRAAAAADPAAAAVRGFRVESDLRIDLGDDFKVFGGGVDAFLAGQLRLSGRLPDAPRLEGKVRVVKGGYNAFGRSLEIERGTLVFSGPVDNPAIDIVAYRRFLPVEAGVALTGTARVPAIALVSRPDVPELDKLSWLVMGTAADTSRSGQQAVALQAAAATLMARGGMPSAGPGFAASIGLDVLSVRTGQVGTSGEAGGTGASAQDSIVTLGKRLSNRLFVSYEQSLRGLQNLVRLQYEITERLSARAKMGTANGIDVIWTWRYD